MKTGPRTVDCRLVEGMVTVTIAGGGPPFFCTFALTVEEGRRLAVELIQAAGLARGEIANG